MAITVVEPRLTAPRPDAAFALPVNLRVAGQLADLLDWRTWSFLTRHVLYAVRTRVGG